MENKQKRIIEIVLEVDNRMNNLLTVPKELIEEYDKLVAEIRNEDKFTGGLIK